MTTSPAFHVRLIAINDPGSRDVVATLPLTFTVVTAHHAERVDRTEYSMRCLVEHGGAALRADLGQPVLASGARAGEEALDHEPVDGKDPFPYFAPATGLKEAGPAALPVLPELLARLRKPIAPALRARLVDAVAAMGPGAASAVPDLVALLVAEENPDLTRALTSALERFGPATVPFVSMSMVRIGTLSPAARRASSSPSRGRINRRASVSSR